VSEKGKRIVRKLDNVGRHNLGSTLNIDRVTELRTINWAGHVAHTGETRILYKLHMKNLKG
jgi:hypothetical protein